MTLSKLSLRNARRQAQDYLVYFVTIVMSAALIYAFNCLVFSEELLSLSSSMNPIPLIVNLTSIAAVCVIGWLVNYTTGFMLSRRSRELGTYILIGMENSQVARLFLLENLAVGGAALVLGLVLGSLVYQVLRAAVLALFGRSYIFGFTFSFRAVGLTLIYFLLIYLFAQFKCSRRIYKMKIYDLIYFDRQNEKAIIAKSSRRRLIFTISIVLGILGTLMLMMGDLQLGLIGAVLIILFLYGFFISFSSGVPAWFDKRPAQKYSGQTLLVFRTLTAKLSAMGVVMASISLLFTAVLMCQGTGTIIGALLRNRAAQSACFDLGITSWENDLGIYLDCIEAHDIPVRDSWQYQVYDGESSALTLYFEKNADYHSFYDHDVFMKFSDYTALRALLGYPEVTLGPGNYLIHCMSYLEHPAGSYQEPVTLGGQTMTLGGIHTEAFAQNLYSVNGDGFILVVPDEVLSSRPALQSTYAAMTYEPLTEAQCQLLFDVQENQGFSDSTVNIKSWIVNDAASSSAGFVFPLYYLALVLTMTAATILTVQQLSEMKRYQIQFQLLQKLGMDRHEMSRALRLQFSIYYAMPAIPPMLIGIPFILNLGGSVEPGIMVGASHPLAVVGITLGLFFLIYFIYILLAYTSLKRNVLPLG